MSEPDPRATEEEVAPVEDAEVDTARRPRTALVSVLVVAVVMALLLAVLATRRSALDRQVTSPLVGSTAPAISGTSVLDGKAASLDAARDGRRWVLVNFFASWCVPCAKEHPQLVDFVEAHRKADDVALIAVVFQDQADDVRDFFRARGGDWPVIDSDRAAVDYGVTGVPESFLIDPDGVVVAKLTGGVQRASLDRLLADAKKARSGA